MVVVDSFQRRIPIKIKLINVYIYADSITKAATIFSKEVKEKKLKETLKYNDNIFSPHNFIPNKSSIIKSNIYYRVIF